VRPTEPVAQGRVRVRRNVRLRCGLWQIGAGAVFASVKEEGRGPIVASEFSPERRTLAQLRSAADVVGSTHGETSPVEGHC